MVANPYLGIVSKSVLRKESSYPKGIEEGAKSGIIVKLQLNFIIGFPPGFIFQFFGRFGGNGNGSVGEI